ncbi:AAC(3) family N-acetyltransferase [bacterium]|nr:AAC(3) family N-acetyltransferase [bacterium]
MSNLRRLLDRLEIRPGANLYVHSSFSYLSHLEMTPAEIVGGLLEHIGPQGTLAMPSFWWNREKGQRLWYNHEYTFEHAPVFDYRNAPCNIGIIPETFRQWPGTRRTLTYWYPISANGPLAEELCRSAVHVLNDHDPDGDGSFGRLYRADFHITGLGVSANTTSLSFLADVAVGEVHTQQYLTDEIRVGKILDGEHLIEHPGYWLYPAAIKGGRPREVIDRSHQLEGAFVEAKVGEAIHFRYPYRAYQEQAVRLGREAAAAGLPMPWLPGLPVRQA